MIYFDNAATTSVAKNIQDVISKYNTCEFINPSAGYCPAVDLHNQIEKARRSLLDVLCGDDGSLVFTSSGSESDNQALFCSKKKKNCRIIISAVEHPAVYNSAKAMENMGFDVQICPVDNAGRVKIDEFSSLLSPNTGLVSIMHVNNETGAVNDIKELVSITKAYNKNIVFHSDGVQAFGKINVNLRDLDVDLYSVSGHKIHAPKGIAGLYIKKGVFVAPLIYGGGQENGIRSSTENVSGILSFAMAAREEVEAIPETLKKYTLFSDKIKKALADIDTIRWISDDRCLPGILTFAFEDVRGEVLQHSLEEKGIYVGTGSACSARRAHERVPKALSLGKWANGLVRISFCRTNTENEVDLLIREMRNSYETLKKYIAK